jgi:hypothetical protein
VWPRRFIVLGSALLFATCFAKRSTEDADSRLASARPSKLDYLVLASMADSPHWLGLAEYRAPRRQAASGPKRRFEKD